MRRRRLVVCLALCLLVAACGGGADGEVQGGASPTTSAAGADPGLAAEGAQGDPAGTTVPGLAQPPVAPGGDSAGTPPAGGPGPDPTSPPAPLATAAPTEAAQPAGSSGAAHLGPPGSFAGVVLRPGPATEIILDVLVQVGARPSPGAIEKITAELARASGKRVTVSTGSVAGDRTAWSAAEIRVAADAGATVAQGATVAALRLLYLRGSSTDAEGALGIAVRGDVAAVFADEVRRSATPLIGTDAIERAVSLHEVGHLLGLVDLFLDTGRGDPEHPGHSPNRRSVMFWAVETGLFADLSGELPEDFDAADLADLATIRAG